MGHDKDQVGGAMAHNGIMGSIHRDMLAYDGTM